MHDILEGRVQRKWERSRARCIPTPVGTRLPVKSAAGPGPAQRHQIPKVGRRVGRTCNHLRRPEAQLGALPGTRQLSIQTDLTGGPQGLDSGLFLVYLEVLGPKFMN